jgi:CheY-like chemotaxis protein
MKTVIVAEAFHLLLDAEKTLPSKEGTTVLTARTAEEILDLHRQHKADLIVAELALPNMGGGALCRTVREDPDLRAVSVILICGNTDSDILEAQKAGANAILTKPVNPADLKAKASELLGVPKRERMQVLMRVAHTDDGGKKSFFSSSHNISTSGLLFESRTAFKKGDRVTCSFFISSVQVVVEAEIVRASQNPDNTFSYGVKFLNLSPNDQRSIEKFIDAREKLVHGQS